MVLSEEELASAEWTEAEQREYGALVRALAKANPDTDAWNVALDLLVDWALALGARIEREGVEA